MARGRKKAQFCKYGHDTFVSGRRAKSQCRACLDMPYDRRRELRWKYKGINLTYTEYKQLFNAQGGLCAICEREKHLVPDHNHTTGKIRALLCGSCNVAIGMFGDKAEIVNRAAVYLDNYAA